MTYDPLVFLSLHNKKLKMTLANFSVKRVCPPVPPVEVINLEPGSEQGMKHLSASYYTVIILDKPIYFAGIDR